MKSGIASFDPIFVTGIIALLILSADNLPHAERRAAS